MILVRRLPSFVQRKALVAIVLVLAGMFASVSLIYFAGSYAEAGINDGLSFLFGALALLVSVLSLCFQAIFWKSTSELSIKAFRCSKPVLWLSLSMASCLLSFSIFGPIAFSDTTSFLFRSRLIPGACILLYFLFSGLLLVGLRIRGQRETEDGGRLSEPRKKYEPLFVPFFIVYFVLLSLPYVCAPFPALNGFFTGSGKIPYRIFTTGLFAAFSLYLWIRRKLKPRWDLLIPISVLMIGAVLAFAFAPSTFTFVTTGLNRSYGFTASPIGSSVPLVDTLSLLVSCFVFFCFVSFIPSAVDSRSQIIWPIVAIVIFVGLTCVYSYITEFNSYIAYLAGTNQSKGAIISLFHSKNTFGLYLFMGCFASAFLVFYIRKWQRFLFLFPYVLFMATGYIAQCNTAVVPSLIFAIIMAYLGLHGLWRKNKALGFSITAVVLLSLVVLVLCVSIESIYSQVKLFERINTKINIFINSEMDTRIAKWTRCLSILTGPYSLIGKTETLAALQLSYYERAASQMAYPDFHSSYVTTYSASGIPGLLFYLFCIGSAFKQIKVFRLKKRIPEYVYLLLLLCVLLLWAMAESFTLFLSFSVISLPVSFVFLAALPYVSEEAGR